MYVCNQSLLYELKAPQFLCLVLSVVRIVNLWEAKRCIDVDHIIPVSLLSMAVAGTPYIRSTVCLLQANDPRSNGNTERFPFILRTQAVQEESRGSCVHSELLPQLQGAGGERRES
jgi:hypothetical protein